ncbi:hypothetical protein H2198_005839 [Neophaeococcomyces mojaviensis]|uniref:Uncharacterized protein n=1 Tax=Neophaeococcomyces mojaviensis TaxID=3383035 RepID=A0ACC3A4F8_9EURO|nr:hypothetical protein H2198_005839 [Knufia sp. JES_112]
MSPRSSLDFPDLTMIPTEDFDEANHQNYLAWKAHHAERRRQSTTLFNLFQCRSIERMSMHAQFKDESVRESEALKNIVERRISNACDCSVCEMNMAGLRESKTRTSSDSPTRSRISSIQSSDSVSSMNSEKSAASPTDERSGRLSLITSPPPRHRHHIRGGGFVAGPERSP